MSTDASASELNPSRKLKLVLKTSPLSTPVEPLAEGIPPKDGSSSPPRPSYSPVTPTLSHEKLAGQAKSEQHLNEEPAPLPLSLDENADAIALKATISLLQMQRQQSLKDIRNLDKIKDAALNDPRGFADELRAGKLKKPTAGEMTFDDVEHDNDESDDDADIQSASKQLYNSKFRQLPNAQNIARCPPIEWSKYHIMGKPLEDMHEQQKRYPGAWNSEFANNTAREHEITAPYRPFVDRLETKKESRQGT